MQDEIDMDIKEDGNCKKKKNLKKMFTPSCNFSDKLFDQKSPVPEVLVADGGDEQQQTTNTLADIATCRQNPPRSPFS